MKTIIIEDEKAAVRNLKALLQEVNPGIEVETSLDSIASSLDWFATHPMPDLLFMDIHLADGSAFEIFDHVPLSLPQRMTNMRYVHLKLTVWITY